MLKGPRSCARCTWVWCGPAPPLRAAVAVGHCCITYALRAGQKVVLVPAEDASKLFTQFLRDSSLRKDVIGILVDPTTGELG